jgi:CcmD family protein
MLFAEGPIETTNYMILGFAVIFTVIFVYVGSLYARANRAKKDLKMLEEMQDE